MVLAKVSSAYGFGNLPVLLMCAMLGAAPAVAAEYCVTCAGPAAMYACAIEGAPRDAPIDPRMQLTCIQELARLGGHETCSVPRSAPQPCPGLMRTVTAPAGVPAVVAAPDAAKVEGADPAQPAKEVVPEPVAVPALPPNAKPPRTVEEMAARTLEASKKGLKKAGDAVTGTAEKTSETVDKAGSAVGNAAKKTWHCLTSLFSEC